MDILALNGEFAIGMFGRFEYKFNRDHSLTVWSKKGRTTATITTNEGDFLEAVNQDGGSVYLGGDGQLFYLPIGESLIKIRFKKLPDVVITKKEMDKERKTVRRVLVSDMPSSIGIPRKMSEVIKWMGDKYRKIPVRCQKSAIFEFGTSYEYGESYPNIEIAYSEKETDQEVLDRLKIDAERKKIKENQELAELKTLKSKYGQT